MIGHWPRGSIYQLRDSWRKVLAQRWAFPSTLAFSGCFMQKSMPLLMCSSSLKAIWSNSHLCCPDARDLSRLTLAGWWGVRPRSLIPLVCPGKTLARLPPVASLSALSGPARGFSVRTWWGWSRWTEPATGSRWSPGCCTARWAADLRVRFLCGDMGLETSWNYWMFFLAPSHQSSEQPMVTLLWHIGVTLVWQFKKSKSSSRTHWYKRKLDFSEEV